MTVNKKQISLRLNADVVRSLDSIAKRERLPRTSVVAVLIHSCARGEYDEEQVQQYFDMARAISDSPKV